MANRPITSARRPAAGSAGTTGGTEARKSPRFSSESVAWKVT
jgi:hypothetical protein